MSQQTTRLPESEWIFSSIEPAHLTHAFFYEYSRQSEKIRGLVESLREMLPYLQLDVWDEHPWGMKTDLPDGKFEEIKALSENYPENEYLLLLCWLSTCQKFPKLPFSKLKAEDYEEQSLFFNRPRGFSDFGFCWSDKMMEMKFIVRFLHLLGRYSASEKKHGHHSTAHLIRVDWWKTDTELKLEFNEWLKTYRTHLKIKPIKTASRGYLDQPLKLPKECKKMDTALAHLGMLRCLNEAGSWNNYLDQYEPDKFDRRNLEKNVSAARKIIAWLESNV